MTPHESFVELRTRRYRTLIDAGIESDMAWEVAHHAALDATVHKVVRAICADADNYKNSPHVYGK